jgi:hypothetical protein
MAFCLIRGCLSRSLSSKITQKSRTYYCNNILKVWLYIHSITIICLILMKKLGNISFHFTAFLSLNSHILLHAQAYPIDNRDN